MALLEGLRVDALGINCGLGPVQMKGIVEALLKVSSLPVIVNPNAGLPRSENGVTLYDIDGDRFAQVMEEIARMGRLLPGGLLRHYAGAHSEDRGPLQGRASGLAAGQEAHGDFLLFPGGVHRGKDRNHR